MAVVDKREQILQRLLAIAEGVPGIITAARNKLKFSDTQLPAIGILDGDELADENDPPTRPPSAPQRVTLTPEIAIMVGTAPADIGALLSGFRALLLPAIKNDATLIGLVQDGTMRRSIDYIGLGSELAYGRTMQGTMVLRFSFTYRLSIADLTP